MFYILNKRLLAFMLVAYTALVMEIKTLVGDTCTFIKQQAILLPVIFFTHQRKDI